MSDLGPPQSYLTFPGGTAMLAADGEEIGTVRHVLAAEDADIFDGLIVETSFGTRFVDARFVAGLYERGAVLTGDAPAAERLPEPSENPAQLTTGPDDTVPDRADLSAKLRRAWDYLSGRY
jgi:phage terminase large subunit-like protein